MKLRGVERSSWAGIFYKAMASVITISLLLSGMFISTDFNTAMAKDDLVSPQSVITYTYAGVTQGGAHDAYFCDVNIMPPVGLNLNSMTELSDAQYTQVTTSDNIRAASFDPGIGDEIFVWSDIHINESPDTVTQIVMTFEAQVMFGMELQLWVYNYQTSTWGQLGLGVPVVPNTDVTITRTISSSCQDYVQNGALTWGCYNTFETDITSVDHMEVQITTTGGFQLDVIAPDGGESWMGGSNQKIQWFSTDAEIYYVNNETLVGPTTGGETGPYFTANVPVVSHDLYLFETGTGLYKMVEGIDYTFDNVLGEVDLLGLMNPMGANQYLHIFYNYTISTSISIDIYYTINNGINWTLIAGGEANDGEYDWPVPMDTSDQCLVRINATDGYSNEIIDVSEDLFTIDSTLPFVKVNRPDGGETFLGDSLENITWTVWDNYAAPSNIIDIYYSLDNGTNWILISAGETNDGHFSWDVPYIASDECLIRINATDMAGNPNSDVSNTVFNITTTPPQVHVITPNGGEIWKGGDQYLVEWTASSEIGFTIDPISIYYSINNGINWTLISTNESNDGQYLWSIPYETSDTCLVMVIAYDTSGDNGFDISNNTFTIDSTPPFVKVNLPNGGEIWKGGIQTNITWTMWDNYAAPSNTITIYYSLNNGTSWSTISANELNDGHYLWTLPFANSDECLVRINGTDTAGNPNSDISDNVFTIDSTAPLVWVSSPNGGEALQGGSTSFINWTSSDNYGLASNNVSIYYSINGGFNWTVVATDETNDGSYLWAVPFEDSQDCMVKVLVRDMAGNENEDVSDGFFTIDSTPPTVWLISPDGGELWSGNGIHQIQWNAYDNFNMAANPVTLYYSLDNGGNWTLIAENEANDGSYDWLTPLSNSTECLIMITVVDEAGNNASDTSNGTFTFNSAPPEVLVISPDGGEIFIGGGQHLIEWTASSEIGLTIDPISIFYSINNGINWTLISTNESNDGQYLWSIPYETLDACLVMVIAYDTSGGDGFDISNMTFTIDSTPPFVKVNLPNGGESFMGGIQTNITWTMWDNYAAPMNTIDIYYSLNNGSDWILISSNELNDGHYLWPLPFANSDECLVRINATDTAGNPNSDQSDGLFTIDSTLPVVTVQSPNGGEALQGGSTFIINWTSSDNYGLASNNVLIYYSINGGVGWDVVATDETNDGSYLWDVPFEDSQSCLVMVVVLDMAGNENDDVSNGFFTIDSTPPTVWLISPDGGELWSGNGIYQIQWNAYDNFNMAANPVTLYYSLDNGGNWTLIVANEANDGSYDWLTPLSNSTECLVMITVVDEAGNNASDTSNGTFTFNSAPPEVLVISPDGGEIFMGGSQHLIEWSASSEIGLIIDPISIYYSINNGINWTLISTNESNDGQYLWSIPFETSDACLVMVIAYDTSGGDGFDISNMTFTIDSTPPFVKVNFPNGGESFMGGIQTNITWTMWDNYASPPSTIYIYYSLNNGTSWILISADELNDGHYLWTLPFANSEECLVRINATDTAGNPNSDQSDGLFTIDSTLPFVTVQSPDGGEALQGGSTFFINWTSSDNYGLASNNVSIYYSINGGVGWDVVATDEVNDGSYLWDVPFEDSQSCLVMVVVRDMAGNQNDDVSNGFFTIDSTPPTVLLISPDGGELWSGNGIYQIQWNAYDNFNMAANPVTLYYSLDNGGNWTLIAENEANDGSYDWLTPLSNSTECLVMITVVDEAGNNASDTSNGTFTFNSAPPEVLVISPDGGEIFMGGSQHLIEWSAIDDIGLAPNPISIYYSINNGINWTVVATNESNDGQYLWSIPFETSDACLVMVIAYDTSGGSGFDISNNTFTIDSTPPFVKVNLPNGGEIWMGGIQTNITWTMWDNFAAPMNTIDIYYSLNNGADWILISSNELNDGHYLWTVPFANSEECLVRINCTDTAGNPNSDISDNVFTIDSTAPLVWVSSPNGNELWRGNDVYEIQWAASDNFAMAATPITLYYSLNNGANWTLIAEDEANDGSYNWLTPFSNSTQCLILIVAVDVVGNSATDESNSTFTIDAGLPTSSVNLIGPYWRNSSPLAITATASDALSGVKNVSLHFRFSADNSTWSDWTFFATDDAASWEWSFDFPSGEGYYEFYTTAEDEVGNVEDSPFTADTSCGYDITNPISDVDAINPYWKNAPIMLTATASDTLSGVSNVSLYYRYSSDNSSWGSWVLFQIDDTSPWEWTFDFPDGPGHYLYYSRAEDFAGNIEEPPTAANGTGWDKQGIVLDVGPPGSDDDEDVLYPSVIIDDDGTYKMWYTGDRFDSIKRIFLATSSDGISWTREGVCLVPGVSGSPDDANVWQSSVLKDNDGTYKMWYTGSDGTTERIMYATSSDGMTWNKQGVVLDVGPESDVFGCHVLRGSDGTYHMWYSGEWGSSSKIYYANSTDGITWVKHGVALDIGAPGDLDDGGLRYSTVIIDHNGLMKMWYSASDGSIYSRILYATSLDGLTWDKKGLALDIGAPGSMDDGGVWAPSVINNVGFIQQIWYVGSKIPSSSHRIFCANRTYLPDTQCGYDPYGPQTTNLMVNPNPSFVGTDNTAWLNATIGDLSGSNIVQAEWYLQNGSAPGIPDGTANPMNPADGSWDSSLEAVTAMLDISGWTDLGTYELWVHGLDEAGNWGPWVMVVLVRQSGVVQLAIIPSSITMTAGGQLTFTVQAQNITGFPANVAEDTIVFLYTTSVIGEFRIVGTGTPIFQVTILAGTSSAQFDYYDTDAMNAPYTLTANTTGLTNGTAIVDVVPDAIDNIVVSPDPLTIQAGDSQQYSALAYDQYGNIISGVALTWSTNAGLINSTGYFTAQTTPILGFVNATNGTVTGTAIVDVIPGPLDHITVTPDPIAMTADDTQQFIAVGYDSYNNVVAISPTWEVDGGGAVNATGFFDATTSGTWTIYANDSGISGSATITITHGTAITLVLTPTTATITSDEYVIYTATAYDDDGNGWDVTNTTTFTDTDPLGYMDNNTYHGGQTGMWTINGTYGAAEGFASVTVNPGIVAFIMITNPLIVDAGEVFNVTVTVYDAEGNVKTDYVGTIHLSSSDPYPALLPPDHTFILGDTGTYTFEGLVLYTRGVQDITATDTILPALTNTSQVTVHAPDIQITKISVPTADPGDEISYTIYYNNTGEISAANLWLNDTLPADVDFVSASDGGVNVGGIVQWSFIDVPPGSRSVTLTVRVKTGLADGTIIENNVNCNYTVDNGFQLSEESDSLIVTVTAPQIIVEKVGYLNTISVNDEIIYTIYYNNTGTGTAGFVWINDSLPAGVAFMGDTASNQPDWAWEDVSGTPLFYRFENVTTGQHSFEISTMVGAYVENGTYLTNWAFLNYTDANGNLLPGSSDSTSVLYTYAVANTSVTFPPGTLVVPMDDQQPSQIPAYGLAYWLSVYGLEVHWIIRQGKKYQEWDFNATTDDNADPLVTGNIAPRSYSGGCFMVTDPDTSTPINDAWDTIQLIRSDLDALGHGELYQNVVMHELTETLILRAKDTCLVYRPLRIAIQEDTKADCDYLWDTGPGNAGIDVTFLEDEDVRAGALMTQSEIECSRRPLYDWYFIGECSPSADYTSNSVYPPEDTFIPEIMLFANKTGHVHFEGRSATINTRTTWFTNSTPTISEGTVGTGNNFIINDEWTDHPYAQTFGALSLEGSGFKAWEHDNDWNENFHYLGMSNESDPGGTATLYDYPPDLTTGYTDSSPYTYEYDYVYLFTNAGGGIITTTSGKTNQIPGRRLLMGSAMTSVIIPTFDHKTSPENIPTGVESQITVYGTVEGGTVLYWSNITDELSPNATILFDTIEILPRGGYIYDALNNSITFNLGYIDPRLYDDGVIFSYDVLYNSSVEATETLLTSSQSYRDNWGKYNVLSKNCLSTNLIGVLNLTKSVDKETIPVGQPSTISSTITVQNYHPVETMTNVTIEDIVENVTWIGNVVVSAGTWEWDGTTLFWNLSELGPMEICTISFDVTFTPPVAGNYRINRGATGTATLLNNTENASCPPVFIEALDAPILDYSLWPSLVTDYDQNYLLNITNIGADGEFFDNFGDIIDITIPFEWGVPTDIVYPAGWDFRWLEGTQTLRFIHDTGADLTWPNGLTLNFGFNLTTPIEDGIYIFPISGSIHDTGGDPFVYTADLEVEAILGFFTLDLYLGWNFISIPVDLENTEITAVLSSISGKWDYALYWDTDQADHWKSYHTARPVSLNDLLNIDHTMGFWLRMTEAATLEVNGNPITSNDITLQAGWNMVGYPVNDDSTYTVADLKADTGATSVEGFNASQPYNIEILADSYVLKRGEGYWIKVDSATTWTVDW